MATSSRTKNRAAQAARARATRGRAVAAATRLIVRDGYLQTTMADIAREAGVVVQTLYLGFGSKVALLSAALDVAMAGDDEPVPLLERPWYDELVEEPDGPRALALFVAGASRIIDRHYPLYAAVRDAAADPELAELLAHNKRSRFASHSQITAVLSGKPGFGPDLTVAEAGERIYALMSQETYGLLVVEHGWDVDDWADWVRGHLRTELFPTRGE